jgi:hypothetical protein
MGFRESIASWVREFSRNCLTTLSRADVAVREGKALDQLRDTLVGSYGIEEVMVDETVSRSYNDPVVNVLVVCPENITLEAQYYIKFVLLLVNLRYGAKIHALFVDGKTRDSHILSQEKIE